MKLENLLVATKIYGKTYAKPDDCNVCILGKILRIGAGNPMLVQLLHCS